MADVTVDAAARGLEAAGFPTTAMHADVSDRTMVQAVVERSPQMPAGRAGTPDEVATLAAHIMGLEGGLITGSDFLIDGGAAANCFHDQDAAHC